MRRVMSVFVLVLIGGVLNFSILSAQKRITGTVTDSDNRTVPGVQVKVQGSQQGTMTNLDGVYLISVASEDVVLVFSAVGYDVVERSVRGKTEINVVLKSDIESLNQVVVTALGVSREKKALGYSVQTIDGSALSEVENPNIVSGLAGKVSGVQVQSSTNLGGSSRILIRGASSLTGNNQPLFVVDGMPIDNANYGSSTQAYGNGATDLNSAVDYGNAAQDINPDDIESISVLKGPNATAQYGSRGANGVILITTKKGSQSDRPRVSFSTGYSLQQAYGFLDLQNEYGGGGSLNFKIGDDGIPEQDVATDQSWGPELDGRDVRQWDGDGNGGEVRPWVAHPDNYQDFFRLGHGYNAHVAFEGGREKLSYRVGYTYLGQQGIVPNSTIKRHTFNTSLRGELFKGFTYDVALNYVHSAGFGRPRTGGSSDNPVYNLAIWTQRQVDLERLVDYKNEVTGLQRTWRTDNFNSTTVRANNPYWLAYEDYQDDNRDRTFGNISLAYKVNDHWNVKGRLGQDIYTDRRMDRRAVGSRYTPLYLEDIIQYRELNGDVSLNYRGNLGDHFTLSGYVGGAIYKTNQQRNTQQTSGGLTSPNLYTVENSVDRPLIRDVIYEKEVQSVYGSITLDYNSFLYLDLSARQDYSSTLPSPYSYFYPAVSLSFLFHDFLDFEPLSLGKIRLGWAQAGNDTDPYQLNDLFILGTPVGSDPTLSKSSILRNPNLKAETTTSYEVGLDLSFWNNRLSFEGSYYYASTSDQIFYLSTSVATGYTSKLVNAGTVSNRGVELSIIGGILENQDGLSWSSTLNFSLNRSRVDELADGLESYPMSTFYTSGSSVVTLESRVGEEFASIYATTIRRTEDGTALIAADGSYLTTESPQSLGTVLADWTMGWRNTFTYKGVTLSALFNMQMGGLLFSRSYQTALYTGTVQQTVEYDKNVWIPEGGKVRETGVIIKGVHEDGTQNTTILSAQQYFQLMRRTPGDHTVYDATNIRLSELSLGYTVPSRLLSKLPIETLRFSLTANNVAILLQYTPDGIDPLAINSSSSNIQGREYGILPTARTYGFKLSMNF